MVKWADVGGFFYKVKGKALSTARSFRKDKGDKIGFRVIRRRGRTRPWGERYMGWQIQYRQLKRQLKKRRRR